MKIFIQTWDVESAGVDVTRWDVVAGSLTLMVFTTRSRGQAGYDNDEKDKALLISFTQFVASSRGHKQSGIRSVGSYRNG